MASQIQDIDAIIAEAEAEVNKENSDEAKRQIRVSLRKISAAKKVLANLELEHEGLLCSLRADSTPDNKAVD